MAISPDLVPALVWLDAVGSPEVDAEVPHGGRLATVRAGDGKANLIWVRRAVGV